MRRLLVALLAAALVATVLVPAASARRAPTAGEKTAIRAAVERFAARPGSPAHEATFRRAAVSTVDPAYAMAKLNAGQPVLATAVLARRAGGWKVVSFGLAGFPFAGVPVKVLNDLLGATLCHCGPA